MMYKAIVIPIIPKELSIILLCMILFLANLGSQSSLAQKPPTTANITTSTTSTSLQNYSNPFFGIQMQYPSKLDLSHNSSSVLIVAFKTSVPWSLNILGGNVSSRNVTLTPLVNRNINQLNQTGNILHLISSTPTSFAGYPAHKIVYTRKSQQGISEIMQLISIDNSKAYLITYAAPIANYTTYLPSIQTMISSIKIVK